MTEKGEKIKNTWLKKYGVDHISKLESVKEKKRKKRIEGAYDGSFEKGRKTKKELYGSENYCNSELSKKTKLEKYGDPCYNNREKCIQTNLERYGSKTHPKTIECTKKRSRSGEIGFKSKKFSNYLMEKSVINVSQLESVKEKKNKKSREKAIDNIFRGDRLRGLLVPDFSENEYSNSKWGTKYNFICCECKNLVIGDLSNGNIPRCLFCYPHNRFSSKIEDEIFEYIKSQKIDCKRHDRTLLGGNEIDILIDSFSIGIECDGIAWHSEDLGNKNKEYHLNKTDECEKKGIKLIHIWDKEWINKKDIVKSILSRKFGRHDSIINSNDCTIKEIDSSLSRKFLEENHLMGFDNGSIRLALHKNEEIVSIMIFRKPKFNNNFEYELSRSCSKINVSVSDGYSLLFNNFIEKYKPKSIISYCDRRFFEGNTYREIGMVSDGFTKPDYKYFHKNKGKLLDRYSSKKDKLYKTIDNFDPNLTEWENMKNNGYDRVWDCGCVRMVWEK